MTTGRRRRRSGAATNTPARGFAIPVEGTQYGMVLPETARGELPGAIELEDGPVRQLRFHGPITKDVVREFRLHVRPTDWPSRVDLSGVTAMDTAGLELLLHLARKQKRFGGELEVVEPPPALRRTMEQGGLTRLSHWALTNADAPPAAADPSVGTAVTA